MKKYITNQNCRICKSTLLVKVFDFGPTPLANGFLKKNQLSQREEKFPLQVYFCRKCSLLQLRDVVQPEILFKNYVYISSTSQIFIEHFEKFASAIFTKYHLSSDSLVIDIGSNDGILLKPFQKLGAKVLGVEPAKNIAALANKQNITTIPSFFSNKMALEIHRTYGPATIITATNVFAHVNKLDELIIGVLSLLTPQGIFVIEVPYLVDFITRNLFDTVYHEHLSYFALRPLKLLFKRFKLRVFDVERVNSHGGSIRVFICRNTAMYSETSAINALIELEKKSKLTSIITYRKFAQRVEKNKKELLRILVNFKKQHKSIAGYGAPAKGNTLLNYFNITRKIIECIADDSPYKQGLYTPGTHIPVITSEALLRMKPDYVVILAWNFSDAIISKFKKQNKGKMKFIVPVPNPKII